MHEPVDYHHERFCFVFGSNQAGKHGKGAAQTAKRFYMAEQGVGEGPTGNAYAIPTKDWDITTRSWHDVADSCEQFIDYAHSQPETSFMVTRVGCGLAGFDDTDIAGVFRDAPSNVWLPRRWEHILELEGTDVFRLIVAGSRTFHDYDLLCRKLDRLLSQRSADKIAIISGRAPRGADPLGERYALERGLRLIRWPAAWKTFDKPAGQLRNAAMAWFSDALALFTNGETPGSAGMRDIAVSEQLPIRHVELATA